VVTGGGSGIGAEIARAFARAGAANIAIIGRNVSTLERTVQIISNEFASTTKVLPYVADITDEASVERAFDAFGKSTGPVHILVHNAGYMSDLLSVKDSSLEEWWQSFEVSIVQPNCCIDCNLSLQINIKGSFVVTQAFLRHAAVDAVLVAIGTGASTLPMPNASAYLSSKFAQTRFFEYVQLENPHIRVHNVHPGAIQTAMAAKVLKAGIDLPLDNSEFPRVTNP
jgi:NAD(P)-dependent dehydrogenase (short-subunit alcohol dehydrogenase family)